jgi:hypothetical protein
MIPMDIVFKRLFSVNLCHRYYENRLSNDFLIVPTALTQNRMRDYGLLFRQTATGMTVLYEENPNQEGPRKALQESLRFSFMLQSRNPWLLNYSDLPLDLPPGQLYCLNNLKDNVQDGQLLLTRAAFVSRQDALELKPLVFQYRDASPESDAELRITDEGGVVKVTQQVRVVEGHAVWTIDLRGPGPGAYRMEIDGTEKNRFYASDELEGQKVFGLVDIVHSPQVPKGYQFTDPDHDHAVLPKTYLVEIDNRKTYWKFYVVLKYQLKGVKPEAWPAGWPENWAVVNPAQPSVKIEPRPAGMKTLADGNLAVPFVSDTPMALQEEPVKGLALKKVTGNGNGTVIREMGNLPNPSVGSVVPDPGESKVFSEVFVCI